MRARLWCVLLLCGLPLLASLAQTATAPLPPLPTPTSGSATPDFSLSVTPPPLLLQRGESLTLTMIVASLAGFNNPVTLSVQGALPSGVGVTFTPATVMPITTKPTWPATVASNLVINTGLPATATSLPAALAGVPFLLSIGLLGWRRRGVRWLAALAVLSLLPIAGGCGSGIHSTIGSSGSLVITVLATASTGQQHTVPLLLRVSE